eukprot:gene3911-7800_t
MTTFVAKSLLSTLQLHDLVLKNRIALAPLTRARASVDGIPKPCMVDYYTQRSTGGLIISEGTGISTEALGWAHEPRIYAAEHVEAWKTVTSSVHAANGVIFCQLWHCGRVSHSTYGSQPVAPSAVLQQGDGIYCADYQKRPYEVPRALETSEIPRLLNDYKQAATCAKEAGFDGVEIHGANGYLLDEFLQSHTNLRDDNYGGSYENKFRLVKEIIETVSTVFPSTHISVRLSPNGVFNDMGNADNFEAFTYYISELNKLNLGFLHVMDGLAFGFHDKCKPMTIQDIRSLYKGIIMANCGYTPESAETVIAAGDADLVAFGRPYISNPDLPERIANGWPLAPNSDPSTWFTPPFADETFLRICTIPCGSIKKAEVDERIYILKTSLNTALITIKCLRGDFNTTGEHQMLICKINIEKSIKLISFRCAIQLNNILITSPYNCHLRNKSSTTFPQTNINASIPGPETRIN